jgi:hypothetical protein
LIYHGKYCDLHVEEYTVDNKKMWRYAVLDKTGTMIEAEAGYSTRGGAKKYGRRKFYNREEDFYAEIIKQLEKVES